MQNGMHRRRLYGRRRGRALRAGQRALYESLLPALSIALPEHGPLDPRPLFGATVDEIWLEIGFGGGEHLVFQAESHPRCGLIGSEVFEPGIAKLLAELSARELTNVRLFADDARLLIAALAPQSIARGFILFPDPWPKERHKKRRIVATDDPDYAQWIEARVAAHAAFAPLDVSVRPADWPPTRYEKKAAAQGRAVRLFHYRRRAR